MAWGSRSLLGPYLAHWLDSATHFQIGAQGISIDRQILAGIAINKLSQQSDPNAPKIDAEYARGAVVRASRNAPAIVGARILWVDGNPSNNQLEENILTDMGIVIRRAPNTKIALSILPEFAPDIIISNIARSDEAQLPLHNCPAHYFAVPAGVSASLNTLNEATMAGTGKATGFGMAEAISNTFPIYTDHEQPRIIFYSASNGGLSASRCARVVTNRVDVLLQSVVSALEEIRWQKLQDERQR